MLVNISKVKISIMDKTKSKNNLLNNKRKRDDNSGDNLVDNLKNNLNYDEKKTNINNKSNIIKFSTYAKLNYILSENHSKFFNLCINYNKQLNIYLFETYKNEGIIKIFPGSSLKYKQKFLNYQNFPFAFSKLININNKAYIIGGILYEESQQKSQYVVQLNHINDYGNIKMNGYIETNLMPKTIYKYVSTQLIYSNLYHTLFVLSGDNQFNCVYNILSACQTKFVK